MSNSVLVHELSKLQALPHTYADRFPHRVCENHVLSICAPPNDYQPSGQIPTWAVFHARTSPTTPTTERLPLVVSKQCQGARSGAKTSGQPSEASGTLLGVRVQPGLRIQTLAGFCGQQMVLFGRHTNASPLPHNHLPSAPFLHIC